MYVGNRAVLRKNKKISYCLAAVEDMDHLARAFRKYPKSSNITAKSSKQPVVLWVTVPSDTSPPAACYREQIYGTRLQMDWSPSSRFTKLTVRHLSAPGDLGPWDLYCTPILCKLFWIGNSFLREEVLFYEGCILKTHFYDMYEI